MKVRIDNTIMIIIGRNEGERLRRSLASVTGKEYPVIYVDSASSDGSVERARSMGVEVVELDDSQPLCAARARNSGFDYALNHYPETKYIQFIDGDCELADGWLKRAVRELEAGERIAIVCGRLRERDRNSSIYSRLCDMEWNTPTGEVETSGGIFTVRADAFERVGGFDVTLIAGEEPELCLRLRQAGYKIIRLPDEMALHDSGILSFGQWWKRGVRSGFAHAQGRARHNGCSERFCRRYYASALFWSAAVPAAIMLSLSASLKYPAFMAAAALGVAGYIVLAMRILRYRFSFKDTIGDAALYTVFCILGKIPQAIGILKWHAGRTTGREPRIIEYKAGGDFS